MRQWEWEHPAPAASQRAGQGLLGQLLLGLQHWIAEAAIWKEMRHPASPVNSGPTADACVDTASYQLAGSSAGGGGGGRWGVHNVA